jgi:hypothetical protein
MMNGPLLNLSISVWTAKPHVICQKGSTSYVARTFQKKSVFLSITLPCNPLLDLQRGRLEKYIVNQSVSLTFYLYTGCIKKNVPFWFGGHYV